MTDGMDFRQFNAKLIAHFRESGGVGELGPVRFDKLVLLTTTARRSGRPHVSPLGHVADDDGSLLLFASNMGASRDPDWLRNIEPDPHVTLEITGATWQSEAEILHGAERDHAYQRWITESPHVAGHQAKAGRQIPMVRVPRS